MGDSAVSERQVVPWHMPQLGNGVETAVIQSWLVDVGASVTVGEAVVVVETDKVTSDLESSVTGTLVRQAAEEGDELKIGELLAEFEVA
jgi:pyruvate/2-oxoglutarate dehydrogenase complex dihydrolipoamide acyltransferase (E2) component